MDRPSASYVEMLAHGPAWPYFSPLGIFASGMALTIYSVYGANPFSHRFVIGSCLII